jgi:hypothetical protein
MVPFLREINVTAGLSSDLHEALFRDGQFRQCKAIARAPPERRLESVDAASQLDNRGQKEWSPVSSRQIGTAQASALQYTEHDETCRPRACRRNYAAFCGVMVVSLGVSALLCGFIHRLCGRSLKRWLRAPSLRARSFGVTAAFRATARAPAES